MPARNSPSRVFYQGIKYRIEWAITHRGTCPGRDVFESLEDGDRASMEALFKRLANYGKIVNEEQFKKLTGQDLWEFKKFQMRFYGNYRPGGRFLIAHGVTDKKRNRGRPQDYEKARRVLEENDHVESKRKEGQR
jgi:hypothetical protein